MMRAIRRHAKSPQVSVPFEMLRMGSCYNNSLWRRVCDFFATTTACCIGIALIRIVHATTTPFDIGVALVRQRLRIISIITTEHSVCQHVPAWHDEILETAKAIPRMLIRHFEGVQ